MHKLTRRKFLLWGQRIRGVSPYRGNLSLLCPYREGFTITKATKQGMMAKKMGLEKLKQPQNK